MKSKLYVISSCKVVAVEVSCVDETYPIVASPSTVLTSSGWNVRMELDVTCDFPIFTVRFPVSIVSVAAAVFKLVTSPLMFFIRSDE